MLLELSELQTRREGWAGSGHAGLWELRIRDFIPGRWDLQSLMEFSETSNVVCIFI